MRLFVAIDLPPVTRAALTRLQGDLRVGRHADPATFHVTPKAHHKAKKQRGTGKA